MVVTDEQLAIEVLDCVELDVGIAMDFAAIGNGSVDRRQLDKVVLAFPRSVDNEQHKPN